MFDLPTWLAQYGQLGVMSWMVFEVRDIRRWLQSHIELHHPPHTRRTGDGKDN